MSKRVEGQPSANLLNQRKFAAERLDKDAECSVVINLISKANDVPVRLLIHPSRGRRQAAGARQLAMYLVHVALGRKLADIGALFGRDRTTVSHACSLIEDRRDDAAFDRFVCGLEMNIEAALGAQSLEAANGPR